MNSHDFANLTNVFFFNLFSVVNLVTKVHSVMNVNHTQAVYMEHVKNHGIVIAMKDGVVYSAIKI